MLVLSLQIIHRFPHALKARKGNQNRREGTWNENVRTEVQQKWTDAVISVMTLSPKFYFSKGKTEMSEFASLGRVSSMKSWL